MTAWPVTDAVHGVTGIRQLRRCVRRFALAMVLAMTACSEDTLGLGDGGDSIDGGALSLDAGAPLVTCGQAGQVIQFQWEIDALEGCQHFLGQINLNPPIDDLTPLSSMEIIDAHLGSIYNRSLVSLSGLERLRKAKSVSFRFGAISNVKPLVSLEEAEREFSIAHDARIVELSGLERLRRVGRLTITNNPALESLQGLSGLRTVKGDLTIHQNPKLPRAEVDWLLERIEVSGRIILD